MKYKLIFISKNKCLKWFFFFFISKPVSITWPWKKIRVAVLQANTITIVAFVGPVRYPNTHRHSSPMPAHRPSLFLSCFGLTIAFSARYGLVLLTTAPLWALPAPVFVPWLLGFSAATPRSREFPVKYLAPAMVTILLTSVWLWAPAAVISKSFAHSPTLLLYLFFCFGILNSFWLY